MNKFLFTSESVSEGHPDKVADRISDAILDAVLRVDSKARVASEVLVTRNRVVLAGEISGAELDWVAIARQAIRAIGYGDPEFDADTVHVDVCIQRQSLEIAKGVDTGGAGDQGLMFGYACRETDALMPAAIHYSHAIVRRLSELRKAGDKRLGPDAKSQVTIEYEGDKPLRAHTVVVSQMHAESFQKPELTEFIRGVVASVLPDGWLDEDTRFLVNPAGTFVRGGPAIDTGLTGRKIIVDTYGGSAPHGGGAFSGKDPTKVDRSGAYAARWLAKNVVAAGIADRCVVQIAYAIGRAEPVSLFVDTFGTSTHADEDIVRAIETTVDLTPGGLRNRLELDRPIYERTAAYGHFGREPDADGGFSWERTDLGESLVRALRFNPLYLATTYVAHRGDATFELRVGSEHPELDDVLRASGVNEWAYLTAWNPRSDSTPDDVNDRERQRLEKQLEQRGVTFFRGASRPDDASRGEDSVLALIDRKQATALGTAFGQNAIVVGRVGGLAKLVWLR